MQQKQYPSTGSGSSTGLLQVVKSQEDGQYHILGLQPGQRLLKMSNGTFKVAPAAVKPPLTPAEEESKAVFRILTL